MEITEVLEKVGLTQKQASVYLALLELGTGSVQGIAGKAGIKRPTAYLILDELQAKGLVSIVPRAKKALYVAESPEYLISDLSRKQELVKRFLPNLTAIYNARKDKPQVQMFSGVEGVKLIYQKIFEANGADFFGTIVDVQRVFPEGLNDFLEKIKKIKIHVRDLLAKTPENIEYAKKARLGLDYEVRLSTSETLFPTDGAIFGNSIVFFSFRPEIFSVLITSGEISRSMKCLFDMAWENAERLPKT